MDKPHKKLDVWKISMDLVAVVYRLTRKLPEQERYNLSSQMRQAVTSIPANIAEGYARSGKRECAQFLHIAQASLSELDPHFEVAKRLEFIRAEDIRDADFLMERVDKMLSGVIRLKRSPNA
jgi:four helix bundle protein